MSRIKKPAFDQQRNQWIATETTYEANGDITRHTEWCDNFDEACSKTANLHMLTDDRGCHYTVRHGYMPKTNGAGYKKRWTIMPAGKPGISNIKAVSATEALAFFIERFTDRNLERDPFFEGYGAEEYTVTWKVECDGKSPVDAAMHVWREIFRRGPWQPNNGDACVFTVTLADETYDIDLSEPRFTQLFKDEA